MVGVQDAASQLPGELSLGTQQCVSLARALVLTEVLGKPLPINVNGAIPAVMLDVGFPLEALKGVSLLARTAAQSSEAM